MHVECENLIMWYLSIWRSNSGIGYTVATVRISRSFFMICNKWINECNSTMIFGYMNGHFIHLPKLNYECKINCLHLAYFKNNLVKGDYISGSTPQRVGTRMWLNQRKRLNFRLNTVSNIIFVKGLAWKAQMHPKITKIISQVYQPTCHQPYNGCPNR